jgi:hypothetical protein
MNRKQRKKKWVIAAALVLAASLIPAEALSPNLPAGLNFSRHPVVKTCGQKAINPGDGVGDSLNATYGSCTAGSDNCCYGYPQTLCDSGGGGHFQSV